jgi:hypothetical protein
MGLVIEGAMQQAAQPGRQAMVDAMVFEVLCRLTMRPAAIFA